MARARNQEPTKESATRSSTRAYVRFKKKIPSLKYISSYERFVGSPAKSAFKELFLGNKTLAHKLKVMSDRGGNSKALKDQECERGNRSKRPPIPYVPVVDEVQEKLAENNSEGRTFKINLSNDTEFRAGVWFYGTPEQFLCHVKQALAALDRMGLFSETKRLFLAHKAHLDEVETAQQEITTFSESDERATAITKTAIAALRGTIAVQQARAKKALAESRETAEKLFSMYANLLSTEKRMAWDKIVERQCDVANWTDLKGVRHTKARKKTMASFLDCTKHHVLTMFPMDAAEVERYYISTVIKKPSRVTVRAFFTRVEQLNSYIELLPSIYNSSKATTSTKLAKPFSESELAGHILKACPDSWQNQYDLNQEHVPQDLNKLLIVLENIEKASVASNTPAKSPTTNGNGNGNGNSEKRKGNPSNDRIPKKKFKKSEKHCVLCQKHGGAANTHNTSECKRFEKDGSPKSGWGSKPSAKGKTRHESHSFAQLKDEIADLKKALKTKSKSRGRKKRRYDSSDSSDSE